MIMFKREGNINGENCSHWFVGCLLPQWYSVSCFRLALFIGFGGSASVLAGTLFGRIAYLYFAVLQVRKQLFLKLRAR